MEENKNSSQKKVQYKKSYAREQYDKLVDNFVKQLETEDIGSWKKSWSRPMPKSAISQNEYSGINILSLMNSEYESSHWLTKNQIKNLSGSVKKEHEDKARDIFFLKDILKKEEVKNKETGKIEEKDIKKTILKSYKVYNSDATEGINFNFENEEKNQNQKVEEIEEFVKNLNIDMQIGEPAYSPRDDTIFMPRIEDFNSSEEYNNTLFHEITHASGNKKRLNRQEKLWSKYDSKTAYSCEEIVAELGSCFLSSKFEIDMTDTKNVEYLKHFIEIIKEKPYILFSMASHSSKSSAYLINLAKKNAQEKNKDKNKSNSKSKMITPKVA
jgi:antirestriction protein ArdC